MGNEQAFLGPRNAHVTETSFLLQRRGVIQGAITGEETLLKTHQADHWKFETLAAVKCHQGDPVSSGVLAVRIAG